MTGYFIAFSLLMIYLTLEAVMGKPTAADLRLGLMTAPVLFAAQEVNEINNNLDRLIDSLHHAQFAVTVIPYLGSMISGGKLCI